MDINIITKQFRDLLQSCFLPALKADLDSLPLQPEHFNEYRIALRHALPLLFDCIEQQKELLFLDEKQASLELRAELTILLCEITAQCTHVRYEVQDECLMANAHRLLQRLSEKLNDAVTDIIFTHYQNKLSQENWKRQLGAAHGFRRFLEIRFTMGTAKGLPRMSMKWMTFCLAVGMCMRECHEPAYKHLSNRIFCYILQSGERAEVKRMNIHCVIYDAIFKNMQIMDSVEGVELTGTGLLYCLDYQDNLDSAHWNCVDDILEALLKNIAMTSDVMLSTCLLKFVIKLYCYFAGNRVKIEASLTADWECGQNMETARRICAGNTLCIALRWAKAILSMFIAESYKLFQSGTNSPAFLLELHRCYLLSILPIPLPVIEMHLFHFYEKFTRALMELIALENQSARIVKLVKQFIETFIHQLQRIPVSSCGQKHTKFLDAYQRLLLQKPFFV